MEPQEIVSGSHTAEVQKEEPQEISLGEPEGSAKPVPRDDQQQISIEGNTTPSVGSPMKPKQEVPLNPHEKRSKVEEFASEAMTFEGDHQIGKVILADTQISIRITGSVQKGSTLSKYTAYIIVGEDEKGKFEVLRRYSEFDSLVELMHQRWPGCFVPTLPDKAMIKNSVQVVMERERLLNNFVKSVASSRHLYYGEEFQLFLRSGETDVSGVFDKMLKGISLEEIVNRYKDVFTELGGKELDGSASIKISAFRTSLRKIQSQLAQLQEAATSMAESKDHLNEKLPGLYTLLSRYEKNTIAEFADGRQDKLVYLRETNEALRGHQELLNSAVRNNPFWLLSDLIKLEQKDCHAFLETMDAIDQINHKRLDCEQQIRAYELEIDELAMGKSTVSSMTTRKSKEEVKHLIEEKNKKCIHEKHNYIALAEMVAVLISYIEIDNYKRLKKRYYKHTLKKLAAAEGFLVVTLSRIWDELQRALDQTLSESKLEVPKPSQSIRNTDSKSNETSSTRTAASVTEPKS